MASCQLPRPCVPKSTSLAVFVCICVPANVEFCMAEEYDSKVGEWQAQEFTSYTWNTGLVPCWSIGIHISCFIQVSSSSPATGSELIFRGDGYPAHLNINQVAQLLTAPGNALLNCGSPSLPGHVTAFASEVRDVERHYTDGWYTVLFDGEGVLEFNMDVTAVHRIARNHIQIYVNLTTSMNNGIGIRVSDTREDDPVRQVARRSKTCPKGIKRLMFPHKVQLQ